MTKLSPSYREDSSEGIDPEIRAYLDKEYFYKLDNLDVKNPKLLIVFAGGNAVGKSVLSERIGRELLGVRLENDAVKRVILQKYPELIMTDALHQLVWKYTMDLYGRLGSLTQNGLVIRDGVITWYYDRILPVFLKQGYELFVVGYDLSERKSRELIEQRGDTPTTTKQRLLDLREDQRIHLERFFREYKADIVLNDETVFDHEAVILAVREKLASMMADTTRKARIYFVRHGQSQANADGTIAGWRDSLLTTKGVQQAEVEATMIDESGIQFDVILASPLSRAYDTAEIIADKIGYPQEAIIVCPDLREKSNGSLEGCTKEELRKYGEQDIVAAGGESFQDFYDRVRRMNDTIEAERMAGKSVLVVGHSGFYRMAQVIEQGLRPSDFRKLDAPINGKLLEYPLLPPLDITTTFEFRGEPHKCEWFDLPKDQPLPELEWQQVYAIGNYEGKVPVVHYPNGPDNLPGGKVDPGETVEMALHREIAEELNMKILSWYPIGYQRVTSPNGEVVNQLRVYAVMDKIGEFVSDPGGHIIGHSLVEIDVLNDAINYGLVGERMMELVQHEY